MRKMAYLAVVIAATSIIGFGQNYKIRQSTSMNGQKIESTVYVKGSRKRTEGGGFMGIGGDVADVEQCDLKRNVKISDKKKLYFIEPFDDGSDADPTPSAPVKTTPAAKPKTTKGGTVTMTSSIVDTGERKQMFGLTARHIKTSMSMTASPDACMKGDMSVETDGWYVDLPQFSCPMTSYRRPSMPSPTPQSGGCRDKMIFRSSGGGKTGFALTETTTMKSGRGDVAFSTTLETLEFSKATLADELFNVPSGYALADSSQDLYGKPDFSAMIRGAEGNDDRTPPQAQAPPTSRPKPPSMKPPGTIRIGVIVPTNKSEENVSTTNLGYFLVQKLIVGNVDAVSVASEADARSQGCDFLLTSEFAKLKQSTASKVGGLLGKVTNTDTSGMRNYDAQVEFVLISLADGKQTLKSKSSDKSQNDVDRAAETVLSMEAAAVLAAIRK